MRESQDFLPFELGEWSGILFVAVILAVSLGCSFGHADAYEDEEPIPQVDTDERVGGPSERSIDHAEVEESQERIEEEMSVWEMAVDTCGRENVRFVNVEYGRNGIVLKHEFQCGNRKVGEEGTVQDD